MAGRERALVPMLRVLCDGGAVAGMSDGQLLDRFALRRGRGEAAEVAFSALVERHGPMVLRVCRSALGDEHDAQDAFQATFLILARKAGSIRQKESASSWLQGVARRVASCSRRASSRRRRKEQYAASRADATREPISGPEPDVRPVILEELHRLAESDRLALELCELEGLSHQEAADRLGWPLGTVKTRVRRAKDRLRIRLTRRGLAPASVALAVSAAGLEAQAALPAGLVLGTVRAVMTSVVGSSASGSAALSVAVATLTELGMRSLLMSRFKLVGTMVASFGILVAGATGLAQQGKPGGSSAVPVAVQPDPRKDDRQPTRTLQVEGLRQAEEERLDRIDEAQLDLEDLQAELQVLQAQMAQARQILDASRRTIQDIAKQPDQTNHEGQLKQSRINVEFYGKQLAELRPLYLSKRKQIRQLTRHIEELRSAPTPAPGTEAPSGDKLDPAAAEVARLDLDDLQFQVEQLRGELQQNNQTMSTYEAQLRALPTNTEAQPSRRGYGRGNLTFADAASLQQYREELKLDLEYSRRVANETRELYLAKSRQLSELKRKLGPPPKSAGRPEGGRVVVAPSVEQSLSDLDQKLDRVLSTIQPRK
jgi:RNA polymerase sigma factor (sigma-70 family)